VLHVDTDPEGGWLVVNKQRMPTPADIELEAYDGKRFPLTAGRRHHEQRVVYVQAEQFVERDGVLRADVRVALKRKSVAVASQIESEQRDAEKTPEEAPQALEEKPVEVPDPATLVAEPEPIADDPATAEP
jgi:hypothetical protein